MRTDETNYKNEILVCSLGGAARIADWLPKFGGAIVLRVALTKDDLIKELSRGHQPICVVEHKVPTSETVQDMAKLFPNGQGGLDVAAYIRAPWGVAFGTTAYELLDELKSSSPNTKFVVTSHTRGSGLSPEERARYKQRKEVLKVMGFTNSGVNYRYLMRLFSRVYLGTVWKPPLPSSADS